ncbi:hypothetical protein BpHYR1_005397 [Brachionus plicatilis]|uniref:Uncharacterized protein n=1 Tax=Brachionus plicatilis TaxID=10195 RepID=A0A3M7R085_BRAPC|nr:hypothetical protein BpHYR1_005397 [Brachionus plicatilis]
MPKNLKNKTKPNLYFQKTIQCQCVPITKPNDASKSTQSISPIDQYIKNNCTLLFNGKYLSGERIRF